VGWSGQWQPEHLEPSRAHICIRSAPKIPPRSNVRDDGKSRREERERAALHNGQPVTPRCLQESVESAGKENAASTLYGVSCVGATCTTEPDCDLHACTHHTYCMLSPRTGWSRAASTTAQVHSAAHNSASAMRPLCCRGDSARNCSSRFTGWLAASGLDLCNSHVHVWRCVARLGASMAVRKVHINAERF
jgi:hypothetical protein